jgi:hypothetical protein
MTVTADEKKCVLLPTAKPGDKFEIQMVGVDKIVLTRLEPVTRESSEVRLEKKDGFTVLAGGPRFDEATIRSLLDEFP